MESQKNNNIHFKLLRLTKIQKLMKKYKTSL